MVLVLLYSSWNLYILIINTSKYINMTGPQRLLTTAPNACSAILIFKKKKKDLRPHNPSNTKKGHQIP